MQIDKTLRVYDLKSLKKKYKGAKVSMDYLCHKLAGYHDKDANTVEIEFYHLEKWSGNEISYITTIVLDADDIIKNIKALKCEVLVGDDARGSRYRAKRADESDYSVLDQKLEKAVIEE